MEIFLTKRWIVIIIAVFCCILWGSSFPALKISYSELGIDVNNTMAKIAFAGMRFSIAGILLLVGIAVFNIKALIVTKRQALTLIIFGIVQTAIQYYFFYNGLAKTSGMQAAILVSSVTFFTIILAHYFYSDDKIGLRKIIGLTAGLVGIIIANWGSFQMSFSFTGEGYMVLSALVGAIGTIMAKELATGIHPFTLTGWQLFVGGLVMLVAFPFMKEGSITFTSLGWWLLIYVSLISTVAFALWFSILKYNKAGEVTVYQFVTPLAGTLLSALLIPGEKVNIIIIVALIFVVGGLIVVNYRLDN